MPSVPPSVPTHTASIVQSTIDSCPAVAAMFAATKGSVARSGSSLPCEQLKISFSLISLALCDQEPPVIERLDRTNRIAQQPCQRGQLLLRGRIPGRHHKRVTHRDAPDPAPELLGQPIRAAQLARVEVVNVPGRGFDRRSEPRTHEVDPLKPSIGGVAEGQLFDDRPASLVMQTEPIADPEAVGHVFRTAPLDLECVGLLEPASELIRDRGRAAQLAKAARQQPTEPDIRIKDRLYALEVPRRERLQERPADDVPPFHSLHSFTSSLVVTGRDVRPVGSTEERRDCRISGVPP